MSAKKKAKPAKKRARAAPKKPVLVAFLTECATLCGLQVGQLLVLRRYMIELLGDRRGTLAIGGALWALAEANGRIKEFEAFGKRSLPKRRAAKP